MRSRAKRPTREELDRILDPNRAAKVINNSNVAADYESSNLEFYLKYDNWEADDALILLCGIDPRGCDIDFDEDGFVKIHSAWFMGRPATHDVPSRDDIFGWIDEINEEAIAYRRKHGIVAPSGSLERKWHMDTKAIHDNYIMFLDLLSDAFFKGVWNLRSAHAMTITRYRLLWESGNHKDRNPPGYYIDWLLKKGLSIRWLEWAKSKGLLPAENTNAVAGISRDSSSLTVFRSMKNLEFCGMKISVDPERYKITISAQKQTASAGFHEFGFFQKDSMIINRAGRVFLQLVNNTYIHSAKGSSRALTDLSRLLKTALDTKATPFLKGVPQFQLSIPKFDEAKQRALGKTFSYDDKIGVPSADDYLKNDYDANPDYPFSLDDDEPEY